MWDAGKRNGDETCSDCRESDGRGNHMFQTVIPFWADFMTVSSGKRNIEEEENWTFEAFGLYLVSNESWGRKRESEQEIQEV